jgi:hexosaminidase
VGTAADISLLLSGAPASVGTEGYQLDITASGIICGPTPCPAVQRRADAAPTPARHGRRDHRPTRTVAGAGGQIIDYPRFSIAASCSTSRGHFFPVATVKRLIDEAVLYKVNRCTCTCRTTGLADRHRQLAAPGRRRAARRSGGDPGGYYTKADYTDIVNYAARAIHHGEPEIDMPGHTNAALASYARTQLQWRGARALHRYPCGLQLAVCAARIDLHVHRPGDRRARGADPGRKCPHWRRRGLVTTAADYTTFMDRAQQIVAAHGKTVVGWHDIVNANELPSTIAPVLGHDDDERAVAAPPRTERRSSCRRRTRRTST